MSAIGLEKLSVSLGLAADASEEAVMARLALNEDVANAVLAATGAASPADALVIASQWRDQAAKLGALAAELRQVKGDQAREESRKRLDEKIQAGHITEAERPFFEEAARSNPAAFASLLSMRTFRIAPARPKGDATDEQLSEQGLTRAQYEALRLGSGKTNGNGGHHR